MYDCPRSFRAKQQTNYIWPWSAEAEGFSALNKKAMPIWHVILTPSQVTNKARLFNRGTIALDQCYKWALGSSQ